MLQKSIVSKIWTVSRSSLYMILLFSVFSNCHPPKPDPDPEPPAPVKSYISLYPVDNTMSQHWHCNSGTTPGAVLNAGKGGIHIHVIGTLAQPRNYNVWYIFDPTTGIASPVVQAGAGVNPSPNYANLTVGTFGDPDRVELEVPVSGTYDIDVYFIEYGSGMPAVSYNYQTNCSAPTSNSCWKYFDNRSFPALTYPQGDFFQPTYPFSTNGNGGCLVE